MECGGVMSAPREPGGEGQGSGRDTAVLLPLPHNCSPAHSFTEH